MKLYHSTISPHARRVRIFLAEKRVDIPLVNIDLGQKEQFSEAYRAINPRSVVPTLVLDDGTAIGEVPAIFRYLEEAYPQHPLLGETAKERAFVAMWERRADLEGFIPAIEAVRNAVPSLKGRALTGPRVYEQIPELVERSHLRVRYFYEDLNERLSEAPFVAGDRYSAADITALAAVDFATGAAGIPVPEKLAALKRWHATVTARPSSQA